MISPGLLRSACAEVLGLGLDRCEIAWLNDDYTSVDAAGPRAVKITAGRRVFKCYECPSEEHAITVQMLSATLPDQGIAMPTCHGVCGPLVLADWVDGTPLDRYYPDLDVLEEMAAYHAALHRASLPTSLKGGSMPQVLAFFEGVLLFAGRTGLAKAAIMDFQNRFLRCRPKESPFGVLHSDFRPTNLFMTPEGSIVSVDNEFLCVGYGREWDVLNTVQSLRWKPAWQNRYLEAYARHGSLHTFFSDRDYWDALYHVRVAGKRLSEGRIDEGREHLQWALAYGW